MKTSKSIVQVIALTGLMVLANGCGKKRVIVAPEPDTEFQSSVDASYALQVISDIDMACSYACEDDRSLTERFFMSAPGSVAPNVVIAVRDTIYKSINISFNNALCRDGHRRYGTIIVQYKSDIPNTNYSRDPKFAANVQLIDYRIDGWYVSQRNRLLVNNLVSPINYDPKTTNLSWSLKGDFDFTYPSDLTKNMHINVDLIKTLRNTSDLRVFPSKTKPINWHLAVAEYKGNMFGEVSGNVPFKYAIKDSKPLVRDFQCAPENVKNVSGTEFPRSAYQQSHPFIDGVGEFTPSDKYPRVIYYGSEDGSAPSCDNSGVIMIKGISYPIDFEKDYK